MKRAQLHDGTVLEFPPETEDEVIDLVVRRSINGSPQEANEADEASLKLELYQGLIQQISGIGEQVAQLSSVTMDNQRIVSETVADMTRQIQELSHAMVAPKRIIRDKQGSIIGVVTGNK